MLQGEATFELGNILARKSNRGVKMLEHGRNGGVISLTIERREEYSVERYLKLKLGVQLQMKARAFYELERPLGSIWKPIYRSEHHVDKQNQHEWDQCEIPLHEHFEDPSDDLKLRITLKHHSKHGKIPIGFMETSLEALFASFRENTYFELMTSGRSTTIGQISVHAISIPESSNNVIEDQDTPFDENESMKSDASKIYPSFINYITGKCEISLYVAIDFTSSNGNPFQEGGLHYIDPNKENLNDYESAISTIGEIVAKYDSDQVSDSSLR